MSKRKRKEEPSQGEREVKIIYYDDGSTIADMSGTRKDKDRPPRQKSTWREKARTFFTVMRKMILPMIATLAAFVIVYLILAAIAGKL